MARKQRHGDDNRSSVGGYMTIGEFTDEEIQIIHAVLMKADPVGVISQVQSVLAKIRAWADAKTALQVAEAAE